MESNRILVVDDEKGICDNVRKILSKKKYEVTQALSAAEALEKMAGESFALLISDIVMPGKNGLELLKLVKEQWPLTKVLIMTAYASTDTAVKAIRLGAVDYIPKPFTPEEIRNKVEKALSGELKETPVPEGEKGVINVIDLDIPFDRQEVAKAAGEEYADSLGPSDMPAVEVPSLEALEFYCRTGGKVCDIFKKLGNTCKAGLKNNECPQAKKGAKGKKGAPEKKGFDPRKLIGIDLPFSYEEVVSATGPEYIMSLQGDGISYVPYEELKARVVDMLPRKRDVIDVDMPFQREQVARSAGETYADSLGPSDMPAVSAPSPETLEHYCKTGQKVCDIFKKLGNTCKAGLKSNECPQAKAKKKVAGKKDESIDVKRLIGIDMPFDYDEVAAVTGPGYVQRLQRGELALEPYENLKQRILRSKEKEPVRPVAVLPEKKTREDILVIDDEVAVNNNIRKILSKKGYSIDQAMTREEALQMVKVKGYRLVLLDLRIPGVKGLELLETIRERMPEAKVIIITGYASIETAVESARLGAVDYLPKPFTPDEIRKVTENAFLLAA